MKALGSMINGKLDLSGMGFTDTDLRKIPVIEGLKTLILSNNQIRSFVHLKPQPNLRTLIAVNNPIRYLDGLHLQKQLENVNITGCPISKQLSFKAFALASIGKRIISLNEMPVSADDEEAADCVLKYQRDRLYLDRSLMPTDEKEALRQRMELSRFYVKEQREVLRSFMMNRAILSDLERFGPLPIVDDTASNANLDCAIKFLRTRNHFLRNVFLISKSDA
jgi:hypothetical protein